MNKMVSVIIPVFNRELYISECLDSVLNQTYQNFEIIVVDDGSNDGTLSICEKKAKEDSRIKVLIGEHKGVSAARNLALDNANGEYVFFLDSDDVIHPDVLCNLVEHMIENVSICIVKGEDVKDDIWENYILYKLNSYVVFGDVKHYSNCEAIKKFFERDSTFGRIGGFLLRKDFLVGTYFRTDLNIGEDVLFIYENLLKGTEVIVLENKGYFWRLHNSKTSSAIDLSSFISRLHCKEALWRSEEKLNRFEFADKEKRAIFNIFIRIQKRNKLFSSDSSKIRMIMREYKKELLPVLSFSKKIKFICSVYFYWLYFPYLKIKSKLKKILNKIFHNNIESF